MNLHYPPIDEDEQRLFAIAKELGYSPNEVQNAWPTEVGPRGFTNENEEFQWRAVRTLLHLISYDEDTLNWQLLVTYFLSDGGATNSAGQVLPGVPVR